MGATDLGDRPVGADEIEIFLQRAAPGEVDRAELADEVGIDTDEMRAALAWLEEAKVIRATETGYCLSDGEPEGRPAAAAEQEAEQEAPGSEQEAPPPGPAQDAHIRSYFTVSCSFGHGPTDTDDGAVLKTNAIAAEIGNALSAAFPRLSFDVEVAKVNAFDQPRSLYPPEDES